MKRSIVGTYKTKKSMFLQETVITSKNLGDSLGSCLKTGQHSIFVIINKIKRIIYVCWIPYLLKIL